MKLRVSSLTAIVEILLNVRSSYRPAQGYLLYQNMIPLRFHTFLQDEADLRLEEDLARLREEPVTGRQFQELHLAHFDPNTRQPLLYSTVQYSTVQHYTTTPTPGSRSSTSTTWTRGPGGSGSLTREVVLLLCSCGCDYKAKCKVIYSVNSF